MQSKGMESTLNPPDLRELPVLLRGEPEPLTAWVRQWSPFRLALHLSVIVLGSAAFGAAMGAWRAPQQAVYTALKFPLVILLTTLGNGLLNGMLAPLLGLDLRFRQSLLAVLLSYSITAAILGAFSPIVFFLVWNTAPMAAHSAAAQTGHNFLLIAEVVIIAGAGMAGNLRLLELLRRLAGRADVAQRVLFAWLAGNLLLGSQLSWILRPFVGSPNLPVEFFRPTALQGNFFESIWQIIRHAFS